MGIINEQSFRPGEKGNSQHGIISWRERLSPIANTRRGGDETRPERSRREIFHSQVYSHFATQTKGGKNV
jgi:hypothetical protein